MRLFLDTEFVDLKPGAKLISIALVAEDGQFFYADCSPFVHNYVLPFLHGYRKPEYQMTWSECALKIGNWIEDRNTNCILACDNPGWDVPYLASLLKDCPPPNLDMNSIFPVYVPAPMQEDIVISMDFDIHNALDDAKVMRIGTLRQEG